MKERSRGSFDWILGLYPELYSLITEYTRSMKQLKQSGRDKLLDSLREGQPWSATMLVSGVADKLALWRLSEWAREEDARSLYMDAARKVSESQGFSFPPGLDIDPCPCPPKLLHDAWLALEVEFTLVTPWYSRDDRIFHVLDNPVRKDWVLGIPYMAAASWKGLLRWACRMQAGLQDHLAAGKPIEQWKDPPWVVYLFGHEKGETAHHKLRAGALAFYPTWFDRIDFEVINPHSRVTRAGTRPIYYEVVPPGARGRLRLLYAPLPGVPLPDGVKPDEAVGQLLKATEQLLTTWGISAKRTVGWGTAQITRWKAFRKAHNPVEAGGRDGLWREVQGWLQGRGKP